MTRPYRLTLFVFLILACCVPAAAQLPSPAAREKLIRETYRKLEIYNAAAQVFQKEQSTSRSRPEAKLSFALTDFRSGALPEILSKRYDELVTLPSGEIVSLTRGRHAVDDGPEEATFAASWERGQYASVVDPQWTIADVLNFEPAVYFDIASYTSYQVTVSFAGKTRVYRALALFHQAARREDVGVPEFWDGVVQGLNRVWEEKRPAFTSKTLGLRETAVATGETTAAGLALESPVTEDASAFTGLASDEVFASTTRLENWLSEDETEHISGHHAGTAEYEGVCSMTTSSLQRCKVAVSNFATFEVGTLSNITPLFSHVGTKDLKTESRTGPAGTTIALWGGNGGCLLDVFPRYELRRVRERFLERADRVGFVVYDGR